MTFPQRIRHHRHANGITVDQASAMAGVSGNSWWRWESGRVTPKLWRAGDIAQALGVPVAALFTAGVFCLLFGFLIGKALDCK